MIPIFGPDDIRPYLSIGSLIPSAESAFRAVSNGTAQAPTYVLHPNDKSDLHVKSATLPGCPIFTVKMAGWSQVLAEGGQAASSGLIAVFDCLTCRPLAILQDDHLISDYRTAAAGGLVAKLLIPKNASCALIVGTGVQARLQAEALMLVRPIQTLRIWGRSGERAMALARNLRTSYPDIDVQAVTDLPTAVAESQVIVTSTGSRKPILQADWIKPGHHVTSVGSDDSTKCEIDPELLRGAQVFVDAKDAAMNYGAPSRAIEHGLIDRDHLTEIGALVGDVTPRKAKVTVACLSGLGIQDLTAVTTFWEKMCLEAAKNTAGSGRQDTGRNRGHSDRETS